ncbi:unnamed protein product [Trichobilharzia szidati]|nr:unnamed protein product [Trichobilharzia szidati]
MSLNACKLYKRMSFQDYVYRIRLNKELKINRTTGVDDGDGDDSMQSSLIIDSPDNYSWIYNIEYISFTVNHKNDTNNNDNNCITINLDILRYINQCLLTTDRRRYSSLSGSESSVYWYRLAKNETLLKAVIQLIPTGYGDPYLQDISMILLRNLCVLAGSNTPVEHSRLQDCQLALGNLIHITTGPLVILSSSFCFSQIANLSTQALDGLLKATFLHYPEFATSFNPDLWTEKLLLFSNILQSIHRCLPKIFFTESNNIGSCEQLSRFAKYITDDDSMNLDILASYVNLLTTAITKLPSVELLLTQSPSSSTGSLFGHGNWEVEKKKFVSVIYYALPNLCLAIGKAWLCLNCSSQLILVYPPITSKCILYIIRIIGCLCSHGIETIEDNSDNNHTSESSQIINHRDNNNNNSLILLHNLLLFINWYHQYRCSWSMCGLELCWCLNNFLQYFNLSLFNDQLSRDGVNCFIDSLLFKLFTLELGGHMNASREVLILLDTCIQTSECSNSNNNKSYAYWLLKRITSQLNYHLKSLFLFWKYLNDKNYLSDHYDCCYIETFVYLIKFLSDLRLFFNGQDYLEENCDILAKLFSVCHDPITLLSSVSKSLSLDETIALICSVNSCNDISSYIISIVNQF